MIDLSEYTFRKEDLGPLGIAETTVSEYIPGMREQGKGVKINCPHDYGVLKTALIGNAGSIFIPDPDQPEMHNLLSASGSKEFMDFLRKYKGTHMAVTFPELPREWGALDPQRDLHDNRGIARLADTSYR